MPEIKNPAETAVNQKFCGNRAAVARGAINQDGIILKTCQFLQAGLQLPNRDQDGILNMPQGIREGNTTSSNSLSPDHRHT